MKSPPSMKVKDLIQQLQENNDTILYQKLEIKHLKEQLAELIMRSPNEMYAKASTVEQTLSSNKKP